MQKICVFTGTRADYGILKPLLKEIAQDPALELQMLASGMHLAPEFGNTYQEIIDDGFNIDAKVEMLLSSDSAIGICKSTGLGLIGFAEALERLQPDIVVILGDRFEAFAMATATMIEKLPIAHFLGLCYGHQLIAHLHGGELTAGAMDEAFRHAITKMSHLHFTSTKEYRHRVIQLGEKPEQVFNVGALGVESIKSIPLLKKEELEQAINFDLSNQFALVTYHPATLEQQGPEDQFTKLLLALDSFPDLRLIFTKANADTGGRLINKMINDYVAQNTQRTIAFTSMGQLRYLSAMCYATLVVGNSSSGILEAPSFGVPTINIGDRQKGRIRATSVIDCQPKLDLIRLALSKGFSFEFQKLARKTTNPYEKAGTAQRITKTIKEFDLTGITKKEFHDLPMLSTNEATNV